MTGQPGSEHISQLADVLWYERQLMEFLLFKLVTANLMLNADERRFVAPSIAEVERVMDEIRRVESERDEVVQRVADELNIEPGSVSLSYLAAAAPEALRATFVDHRDGFMELTSEIEKVTRENRRLATVGLSGIRGTFNLLDPGDNNPIYDASGKPSGSGPRSMTLNEVL